MPFVRIDLPRGKTLEYRRTLGDVVYEAMIKTINVPANDRFQVITEHPPEDLIVDRNYLGIERTAECVLVQVFLNEGRTTELKKAFYNAIAEGLLQRLGLRKQDVFITLVEVKKENWSFGNGEAQYA
jgi:phenylpyruvate tautomerase PptA (4-oxalocrotonate tautomerase family)